LALIALVSGVAVGANHDSAGAGAGSTDSSDGTSVRPAAKLSAGGLGSPPALTNLVRSQAPVPILMYHVISSPPPSAQLPELYVDPNTFVREMEWLNARGYQGVSLNQVYDAWFHGALLPEKPVVISFDDGYRGQYVYARPELRKLGWPGVLSAISGRVGQPAAELSDSMVQTMIEDGWELDSHTVHHLDVTTLGPSQLRSEIAGSRTDLEQRFHQPVNFFCYPGGRYDAQAVKAVKDAGYLGATTEDEGLADKREMLTLKRIRVEYSDGLSGLQRKLRDAGA
jgi:peptidoglycan/xylan/chitin deacetylase (PgdA/CDA1 family)